MIDGIELKRQALHGLGLLILGAIPLFFFSKEQAMNTIAVYVVIVIFCYWYIDKRKWRREGVKEVIHGFHEVELISPGDRKEMMKSVDKWEKVEDNIIENVVSQMRRTAETATFLPSFYAMLGLLLALILFGQQIAILALITLAVGDSFSTIIGKTWGIHRLFWNKKKSWEGTIAFFISSLVALSIFLYYYPSWAFYTPIATLVVVVAIIGAVIESAPSINDNIAIPLGISILLYILMVM